MKHLLVDPALALAQSSYYCNIKTNLAERIEAGQPVNGIGKTVTFSAQDCILRAVRVMIPAMISAPYDQSASPFGVKIPFAEHLGIQLVSAVKEGAVISIEKRPELSNSFGAMHGGVLMTVLDLVMTVAVRAHYGVASGVITIDMSIGFMNPGLSAVSAEGRVLNAGKSTCFCESEARDDKGLILAKAIGTFRLMEARK